MADLHLKASVNRVPVIEDARCRPCRQCLARRVCKNKAIVQLDPCEPPAIDAARCYGCLVCIDGCPSQAILPRK